MNVLATPCATSLPAVPPSTRKRKRENEPTLPPLPGPVTIHAHPSTPPNPFDPPPPTLTPATLLHRHLFPLQWLSGHPPKLFTARELTPLDMGLIMIVKVEGERTLYACEAVDTGVYALARLGNWVRLGDVRRIGGEARKLGLKGVSKRPCLERGGEEWWRSASMDYESESEESIAWDFDLDLPMEGMAGPTPPPEENIFREPGRDDILEQVKSQYFEAVYLAKTSIAYFAKSTLARARVFFYDSKQNESISTLVEFLDSMVIPLAHLDEKYKSAITAIALHDDKAEHGDAIRKDEVKYVKKWVVSNFGEHAVLKKGDKQLKDKIEELKIRETELQIIVLLEILSIRKEHRMPDPAHAEDEEPAKKTKKQKPNKLKKKAKKAKVIDKETLLDLLVDRLCIWRSLGATLAEMMGEGKIITSSTQEQDSLRHFCMEVVMAFYSSRLPDKVTSISKKCNNNAQPNAPPPSVKKPQPPAPKKRGGLSRSFTAPVSSPGDSLANSLSRDLLGGPSKNKASVRTGGMDASKLAKREVAVSTIKSKKEDKGVMDELKEAINALKRPNRGLHGQVDMQSRESRLFGLKGKGARKSANPTRIPPPAIANKPNVLVAATPSKPRAQRDSSTPPRGFPETPFAAHHLSAIPESSPFVVASPMPDSIGLTPARQRTSGRPGTSALGFEGTPTRVRRPGMGLSRSYTVGGIMSTPERGILETPVRVPSNNSIMETPVKRSSFGPSLKKPEITLTKPVEASKKENAGGLGTAFGDDLYKKLGWDDEEFVF